MTERNKAAARRLYDELIGQGRFELIDDLVDADFVDHEVLQGFSPGRDGIRELFTMFREAFSDLQFAVEDMVAEGDRVAARITVRGTHDGPFMGIPPTGNSIAVEAIDFMRFAEGKLVEHWGVTNETSMMQQLGVMPVE